MSLVIPNTLGSRTTSIQLTTLDENFEYFRDQLNPYVNAISIGSSNAVTLNGTLTYAGVTLSNSVTGTGSMVLSNSPALTGTATAVNLTISGNLTVSGTTTTVNTTNTVVKDSLIELNSGAASNVNDIGIIFQRGSTGANAALVWNETNDRFSLGTTTATGASTGALSITTGTLAANILGNVTGNVTGNSDTVTNGVYTTNFTGTGNQSLTSNGYQKLPGGLIIQWGTYTATASSASVTFPTAFSVGCYSVTITSVALADTAGVADSPALASLPTTTGFTVSNVSGRQHYWMAIGT